MMLFAVGLSFALLVEFIEALKNPLFIRCSTQSLSHITNKSILFSRTSYLLSYLVLFAILGSSFFITGPWITWAPAIYLYIQFYSGGKYNGGSSTLLFFHLLALPVLLHPDSLSATILLGYKVYFCLHYFAAGLSKLLDPHWRNGKALGLLLKTDMVTQQASTFLLKLPPRLVSIVAYSTIIFELTFPLALLGGNYSGVFVALGLLFHLSVYLVFGLNRFFWTWICAYPLFFI